jgi:hypothetical protein
MTERRFRNWLPPKRLTPSAAPAGGTEQHLETFMADVLALAGAEPDAIGEGVRVALAKAEAGFRASKSKKRMKDAASCLPRSVPRACGREGRRGTHDVEHLALVLVSMDRR